MIFVSATLLGFASHAPGGLGVFDAAMLVALWQFDKEDVLAGLLLFRLLYYVAPFVIALVILGAREIWLNMHGARRKAELAVVTTVASSRSIAPNLNIQSYLSAALRKACRVLTGCRHSAQAPWIFQHTPLDVVCARN